MRKLKITFILLSLFLGSMTLMAQVTTSGLRGSILDDKNEPLPGATIVAVHQPSGTQYAVLANAEGRFSITNMRVGGPYQVTASFVGYKTQIYDNIILSLGNVSDIIVSLAPTMTELTEVIVTAGRNAVINSERTGAAINVNNEMVGSVPTISRGLKDFTKVSPLANTSGSGTSFAGANNRYNQFAIDGLVNNDVFGLTSSGTNGGQTGIEPISLDAIEEFQINIAPYDVRQGGFTGGGINAVTKSGTNTFKGSVYFFGNNEKLVGKNSAETMTNTPTADYSDYQAGFTIGGPIIKNKLFFFLNGEITRQVTPNSYIPGTPTSNITVAEVNRVLAVLDDLGYDPGEWETINDETNSNKILAKLNWNINDNHKLVLRHSYTFGENIENSRTANSLRFYNNGQYFPSTTNSTGLELNSILGADKSNKLSLGYTRVRDDRDPLGDPFPEVTVYSSGHTMVFGGEYSSVANQLDQDIYSITDDFSWFLGKHTLTFGTHNELYSFYNLFVQNIYGRFSYQTLENFETIGTAGEVAPNYFAYGWSFDESDDPLQSKGAATWSAMQLGLFAQDEFELGSDLTVTAGLRVDMPLFMDKPEANAAFNADYASEGIATGVLPDTRIMFSPRLGFNWDVLGNKTLQVRGGTGLFTGRVPFVWISNQFTNNGNINGSYSRGTMSASQAPISSPAGIKFNTDPEQVLPSGVTVGRGAINTVGKDFKFPQVFRTNLAVDIKLPLDIYATVEGIFSKTYNNVLFYNYQRQVDEAFTFIGADQRPRFLSGRVNGDYDEIIDFRNTNEGYAYNVVAMLQKQFGNGLNAQVSYTYGTSYDINSGTSSVAYSNWRYNNNVNGPNDLPLTISNYDLGHRVTGLISYRIEYMKNKLGTQVSLFYNGQSGQPLSYIYFGDMNNDGTNSNDLIYIPENQSEINLITTSRVTTPVDEQWAALDAFIEGDPYLSKHRGEYAERNGARLPFMHNFDLRLLQDVKVNLGGTSNKLQLSLDILNIGNLINQSWGHNLFASNQANSLITYESTTAGTPNFTYTGASLAKDVAKGAYQYSDFLSRWRMQIGVRYIFN